MARQYYTDCEGPISKNDNAQELCSYFLPNGGEFFARVSAYDDYLADVAHKTGYKAGDTLRLILPFLRAYGVDNEAVERYSREHIRLVPGAAETLTYIRERMPTFIISTSYSPYIRALCDVIGFPVENTYSTPLDLDGYYPSIQECYWLKDRVEEIVALAMIEIPKGASRLEDLPVESRTAVERLDTIFWDDMPRFQTGWGLMHSTSPVGGEEKAKAIQDILRRTGNAPADVMYVGDSITDVQAFDLVRIGGGVAVSFNGNRYALREAEVAVIAGNAIIQAILADVFRMYGKEGVLNLANRWRPHAIHPIDLASLGVDQKLWERFFSIYPIRSARNDDPNLFPQVEVVTDDNREELTAVSEDFRKTVRGEEIGRLG